MRSASVGCLLDPDGAQAEAAQQKLERSTQRADAAAAVSGAQYDHVRGHAHL